MPEVEWNLHFLAESEELAFRDLVEDLVVVLWAAPIDVPFVHITLFLLLNQLDFQSKAGKAEKLLLRAGAYLSLRHHLPLVVAIIICPWGAVLWCVDVD